MVDFTGAVEGVKTSCTCSVPITDWNFTMKLCVMTLNKDTKFEEIQAGSFKNDVRNLINFMGMVESLQISTFLSLFGGKCILLKLKINLSKVEVRQKEKSLKGNASKDFHEKSPCM